MIRNVVLFVMSPFQREPQEEHYTDSTGVFAAQCMHTNETGIKYMKWKLDQDNEQIDAIYAFISQSVANQGTKDKLTERLTSVSIAIQDVELAQDGELPGALQSVSHMFDVLKQYQTEHAVGDTLRIHVDMTGGPRHASMLMLMLLQMLQYSGMERGKVIYTNYKGKGKGGVVEDASGLMDMFTLMSGAEAFTAFGNVEQIRKYFKAQDKDTFSEKLQDLLAQMDNVSEVIRVCGSYETMQDALVDLQRELTSYEKFIRNQKAVLDDREVFFSKLLGRIWSDYVPILPLKGKKSNPLQIIRWCIQKGFLQQALIFYTEWIPQYLIKEKFVTIVNKVIEDECKNPPESQPWENWEVYLFKNYIYQPNDSNNVDRIRRDIRAAVRSKKGAAEISLTTTIRNKKFTNFLDKLNSLNIKISKENYYNYLCSLPDDDEIKIILDETTNKMPFEKGIKHRIENCKSLDKLVLEGVGYVSNDLLDNLFDIQPGEEKPSKQWQKGDRKGFFREMINKGYISTTLDKNQFLNFVVSYTDCVNRWRNKFSHASTVNVSDNSNRIIEEAIKDSLKLLQQIG